MPKSSALEKAIELLGSQTAVALAVKRTPQAVSDLIKRGADVPAEWCIPLERATEGRVTRNQLRPDIYPLDEPAPTTTEEEAA